MTDSIPKSSLIPKRPKDPFTFTLHIEEWFDCHGIYTHFFVESSDQSLMEPKTPDGIRRITAFLRKFCDDMESQIPPEQ